MLLSKVEEFSILAAINVLFQPVRLQLASVHEMVHRGGSVASIIGPRVPGICSMVRFLYDQSLWSHGDTSLEESARRSWV